MDKLLDDSEVKRLAGKDARVVTYPEISQYTTVDQLFAGRNKVIILYLNDKKGNDFIGHWVLLLRKFKKGKEIIEFNDSYSNEVDEFLDDADPSKKKRLGQDKGHLSRLLYNHCIYSTSHKVEIIYNEIPFQKVSPLINTCGRWVGLRGHFSNIPLDDYQEEFKKLKGDGYDLDKVVTLLTNKLLKDKATV